MDRQSQVSGQQDEVFDARRNRRGLQVLDRLLADAAGVFDQFGPFDSLIAGADGVGPVVRDLTLRPASTAWAVNSGPTW